MNAPVVPQNRPMTKPTRHAPLKGATAVLGLSAGAIGWSSLAQATGENAGRQTVMMPDAYRFDEDGRVLLSLTTGEQVVLLDGQYVILEGGLLLIVDELTQAAMSQLPVMGALRTDLVVEDQIVRSPDGTVIKASNASPLWSGEGEAPRLFEHVDIQRYELAQETLGEEEEALLILNEGTIAGSLLATMALAFRPEEEEDEEEEADQEPEPPALPNDAPFWVNAFDGLDYAEPYTLSTAGGIYGIADPDGIVDLIWTGAGLPQMPFPAAERDTITITVVDIQTNDLGNDDPSPPLSDYVSVMAGLYDPPAFDMTTGILKVIIQPDFGGLPVGLSTASIGDTWTVTLMIEDQLGGSDTLVTEWSM